MTTGKRRIPINNHEPRGADPAPTGVETRRRPPRRDRPGLHRAAAADSRRRRRRRPRGRHAAGPRPPFWTRWPASATLWPILFCGCVLNSTTSASGRYANWSKLEIERRGELLSDLLPVLDNLERALDAAEHHEESKVLGGVRMTRDLFVDLLRRSGVEEIETVGAAFDPHVHDAVLVQPSDQDEGRSSGCARARIPAGRPGPAAREGDGVVRAEPAGGFWRS